MLQTPTTAEGDKPRKKNLMENFPQGKTQSTTRDVVAKQIGLGSGRNLDKAKKIWEKAKTGDSRKGNRMSFEEIVKRQKAIERAIKKKQCLYCQSSIRANSSTGVCTKCAKNPNKRLRLAKANVVTNSLKVDKNRKIS